MTTATAENRIIDESPLSSLQIRTLLLCGLVGVLDGNDTQVIGLGAPSLAAALHVAPSAMGWAISGSWLGAAVGALIFGRAADRLGRKSTLIAAVIVFSIFTLLTPFAHSLPELVTYRVLTGIGLGGATPCFIALASEYAPARMRGGVVSLVWASFPLGLLLGGLANGWLLAQFSWEAIFYVGGGAALLAAAILVPALPESVAFLLGRKDGLEPARRILAQIAPGRPIVAPPAPVGAAAGAAASGLKGLFTEGRLQATLCIWVMLFTCFGTTASMSWVPTILRQQGVSLSVAAVATSFLGLGALLGMAIAGRLVDRFGAAKGLVGPVVVGAGATALMGYWVGSPLAVSVFITLVGALVGLGASGGIALIGHVYPSVIRSTGAGWAMGLGRFGQVVVPAIFALLMGAGWTAETIFLMLGIVPLLGAAAALFVQRREAADWRAAVGPASLGSERPKVL